MEGLNWLPVIVTIVPIGPDAGVKDVITGAGKRLKVNPVLEPVPLAVVTATDPEEPPATIAVIDELELTIKESAGIFPKVTFVAPVKPIPVILMEVFS